MRTTTTTTTRRSRYIYLLLLLLVVVLSPLVGGTFQWDKDSLLDCHQREEAGQCTQDGVTFYQCPISCTSKLRFAGMRTHGEANDPEDFFELSTPLVNGKKLTFDRFEGYVTMIIVIPLVPGMAQYYYDMLEHLHKIYPFTIEMIIFPVRLPGNPQVQLHVLEGSKITVLPELQKEGDKIESNPVLKYLENTIHPSNDSIFTDRVTLYIVSYNARFIEKEASPTLDFLEHLIQHYIAEMEWREL
jgi:hypothetical protein